MALMDVAKMQHDAESVGTQHGVSREEPMREQPRAALAGVGPQMPPVGGPSAMVDGIVLDTPTLCLYGIALADLLLLYIAYKVS